MATRKTWAIELAARCRRVDWDVRRQPSTGGYKVTCPDGYIVSLHTSASDVNAPHLAERILNEHGLAQAEQQWREQREQDRQAKIVAGRKAAETQARRLALHAESAHRAAGPYAAPVEVELDWFLAEHPAPWMRWVIITPELAQTLLDKLNSNNRPLNERTVEHYMNVIAAGQWHLTHQGMAIDRDVVLQDGQHRLAAIARAGLAVPVAFFVGMDPNNFKAIDEGLLRQAHQLFSRDGEKHTTVLAGLIRLANVFSSPIPRSAARDRYTNELIYDQFAADADEIRQCAIWATTNRKAIAMPPSALGALRYLLRRANGQDNPYVAAFLSGLLSGLKAHTRIALDEDDPRLRLRAYVQRKKEERARMDGLDHLALAVKTWNYVVDDVRPRNLRHSSDQAIPIITVCQADGPNASAAPPLLREEVHLLSTYADEA